MAEVHQSFRDAVKRGSHDLGGVARGCDCPVGRGSAVEPIFRGVKFFPQKYSLNNINRITSGTFPTFSHTSNFPIRSSLSTSCRYAPTSTRPNISRFRSRSPFPFPILYFWNRGRGAGGGSIPSPLPVRIDAIVLPEKCNNPA